MCGDIPHQMYRSSSTAIRSHFHYCWSKVPAQFSVELHSMVSPKKNRLAIHHQPRPVADSFPPRCRSPAVARCRRRRWSSPWAWRVARGVGMKRTVFLVPGYSKKNNAMIKCVSHNHCDFRRIIMGYYNSGIIISFCQWHVVNLWLRKHCQIS